MRSDLHKFEGVSPYASELYGIYQPLLGWKSQLAARRIDAGLRNIQGLMTSSLFRSFRPDVKIIDPVDDFNYQISLGKLADTAASPLANVSNSLLVRRVLSETIERGIEDPQVIAEFTTPDRLVEMLRQIQDDIRQEFAARLEFAQQDERFSLDAQQQKQVFINILERESVAAGVLSQLQQMGDLPALMSFYLKTTSDLPQPERLITYEGFRQMMDPRSSGLANAVLSPVGLVHFFRQYFFELDTFLGPAIEHLWLSPGATVELVEVSRAKRAVQKPGEDPLAASQTGLQAWMIDDELSAAVRAQNSANARFGMGVHSDTSFGAGPVFTALMTTGNSYSLEENSAEARTHLHRGARLQSAAITSELKRKLQTSFQVAAGPEDRRGRRYTIQNPAAELVNYEFRRKMREVGVQVQDYGARLCWQTYVDKPGDQLGLANLVHIAVPNDMPPLIHPQLPPDPAPYKGETIKYHFRWPLGGRPKSPILIGAVGLDLEFIAEVHAGHFRINPIAGFKLDQVDVIVVEGDKWDYRARGINPRPIVPGAAEQTFTEIELYHPPHDYWDDDYGPRQPFVDDHPEFTFEITPYYLPSDWLLEQVRKAKEQKIKEANQVQEREYKEKLFAAVKERVRLASRVQPRKFEDLREEERIIIYRNLISQLLQGSGVVNGDARVQHLFAELVSSLFDIEKMLYFVAPEWWLPQNLSGGQNVFRKEIQTSEFTQYSTVSWGGARAKRANNYYITEDSTPAVMGSSLGWVIELDGDALRNAFLNAPWVKAVIPIREGKEAEALGWLSSAGVEGSEGMAAVYDPPNGEEVAQIRAALGLPGDQAVTIKHALDHLVLQLQASQAAARQKAHQADGDVRSYLPADRVYEAGFQPLADGFSAQPAEPFEIFDQWVEETPTDQVVPIPVDYDPLSGMKR